MTADDAPTNQGVWMKRRDLRVELEGRLTLIYSKRPIDDRMVNRVGWAVDKLQNGGVGRMVVVCGDTHVGKSSCIERAISMDPRLQNGDEPDAATVVYVELLQLVSSLQLGREILIAAGYPLRGAVSEGIIWERVRDHLQRCKTRVLWIDEAQSMICIPKDGNFDDKQYAEYITNKLKALMKQDHRMSVVLSGLTPFRAFVRLDEQVAKMASFVDIARLSDTDVPLLTEMIGDLATEAGLKIGELLEGDLVPRLMRAADYAYGDAIRLTIDAILDAAAPLGFPGSVPKPDDELRVTHFATAFADMRGDLFDGNPFSCKNWSRLDCSIAPRPEQVQDDDGRGKKGDKKTAGSRGPVQRG